MVGLHELIAGLKLLLFFETPHAVWWTSKDRQVQGRECQRHRNCKSLTIQEKNGLPENMRIFLFCDASVTEGRLDRGSVSDESRRVAEAMMKVIW